MNSTVPHKVTGDTFSAAECDNVVDAVNSKQDQLTFTPENTANKNAVNGYAGLDSAGKLLSSQWPAGIDQVVEYSNLASFPATGLARIIYVAQDVNAQYRWSGSAYIEIVASPGTTDNVPEGPSGNALYFTKARVLATLLTGIGFGTMTAILATDNILQAFGKIQAQLTYIFQLLTGGTTGQVITKNSPTNFDFSWATPTGGGGVSGLIPTEILFGKSDGTIEQDTDFKWNDTVKSLLIKNPALLSAGGDAYFLGTSITAGASASIPANRFSSLFCTAFGLTEHNFGVASSQASDVDLSNIPIYNPASDRLLFVEYGTNDTVLGGVSPATFQSNMNIIMNNAITTKGWPASRIVLMTTFGCWTGADAGLISMNTVILNTATSFGSSYVENFDSMRANSPESAMSLGTHPNDWGYKLILNNIISSVTPLFVLTDQHQVINGTLEVSNIRVRKYPLLLGDNFSIAGVDRAGNVGITNMMPNGLILNKTLLNDVVSQVDAIIPTGVTNRDIVLESAAARIMSAFSTAIFNWIELCDGSANMNFHSNYVAGYNFYNSDGLLLSIKPNGDLSTNSVLSAIIYSNSAGTYGTSGYGGKLTVSDFGTGNSFFENNYSGGLFIWYMSNGTALGRVAMYQINQFGRILFQEGGAFTDIPSARMAINSTTEGFLTPRMTTAQKNAIVSPQEGLEVYDLTLHKKCVFTGSVWETITSA